MSPGKRVKRAGTIAEPAGNQNGNQFHPDAREGGSGGCIVPPLGGDYPRTPPNVCPQRQNTTSEPLTFVLPLPPNLGNSSLHWAVKARQKKAYLEECDGLQNIRRVPLPPRDPFVKATVSATMYVGKLHDDENAKFRAYKWPCDWLKTRGYMLDDNPKVCTMLAPEQVVKQGQEYRVVITLSPLR